MSSAYTHTSSTHWTDFLITLLCGFQGDRQGATQLEDRIQLLGSMGWPLGAQQAAGVTSGSHPGLDLSAQSCRRALRLPILAPFPGEPRAEQAGQGAASFPSLIHSSEWGPQECLLSARGAELGRVPRPSPAPGSFPQGLSLPGSYPGPHVGGNAQASAWRSPPRQGPHKCVPPHQLCLGDLPQLEP